MVSSICNEWIQSARRDFLVIESVLGMIENPRHRPNEQILYHCQQAAEKILKAFLFNYNQQPWGHDLNALRTECSKWDITFNNKRILDHCAFLQAYNATRYPDYTDSIDASIVSRGINSAKRIYDFVSCKLGLGKVFFI